MAYTDDEPESGSGAVPDDFQSRTVLRCLVDYTTMRTDGETDRFTIAQWSGAAAADLEAALRLPNREFRPRAACAAGSMGTTALYLVDDRRRAIRLWPPVDEPCSIIRPEVSALLPSGEERPELTFTAGRRAS